RSVRTRGLRERAGFVRTPHVRPPDLRPGKNDSRSRRRRSTLAVDRSPRADAHERANRGPRAQVRTPTSELDGGDGQAARARSLLFLQVLLRSAQRARPSEPGPDAADSCRRNRVMPAIADLANVTDPLVWRRVVFAMLLAFALGQTVAVVYMATFRGLSYSR